MFTHYLKTTFRNAWRNKIASLISIIGLATGLASCILIFLYVRYETSFDTHHSKVDRIFHIVGYSEANKTFENNETPFPLVPELRNKYPEIETATRIYYSPPATIKAGDKLFRQSHIVFVEPEFQKLFDLRWIHGNPATTLTNVNEVVVTKSFAQKVFGSPGNALNKVFTLGTLYPLTITGVVEDPPVTTHLPYSMLVSLNTLTVPYVGIDYDRWTTVLTGFHSYVLLSSSDAAPDLQNKIRDVLKEHSLPGDRDIQSMVLQPLKEIHFNTQLIPITYSTSKTSLWIISIIGLITLFIAAFNFLNLTIAQSLKRTKEVGIKRAVGADKQSILFQFLSEALWITLLSLIIALILVEIFLPTLNQYLGNDTSLSLYSDGWVILLFLLMVLIVSALTGIYPGLIASSYLPTDAIKTKVSSPKKRVIYLKNGILTFQFIISQVLIIGTLVIYLQLQYIEKKDLGFNKENIIQLQLPDYNKSEVLSNLLLSNPVIVSVSAGGSAPLAAEDDRFTSIYYPYGSDRSENKDCEIKAVGLDYLQTFQMKLLAGEWLTKRGPSDSLLKLVVNETLVKEMGWTPGEAIGKRLNMGYITGVMKDFHAETFQQPIMPEIMVYYPRFTQYFYVKVNGKINSSILEFVQKNWEKTFPEQVFSFKIYDDYIRNIYARENRAFDIIRLFALISIIIACLGVFGMVSFLAAQKIHEFSMRKVLGASGASLFLILSKNYFLIILAASVIGWPIAWYLMSQWLGDFVFRIGISWWIFLIAFLLTVFITGLTILYHAIKVANLNPATVLKYE